RTALEESDHRHRRLLRVCHERRCRCAAEQRDEIAPFHCPVPPVLPNKRNSTRGTAALRNFNLPFVRFGSFASDRHAPDLGGMSASPRKRTNSGQFRDVHLPTRSRLTEEIAIGIGIAMTLELKMLALSIVRGLIQIVLASHAASLQRGYVWTASSRDEAVSALTGVAGRLARALQNFVETFPLFAAAVLIAHVAATHSWMTEWGVQLYFWGRVAYLALYAAGVFLLRSLVWNVAALGIVLVLLSLV